MIAKSDLPNDFMEFEEELENGPTINLYIISKSISLANIQVVNQ